MVTLLYDGSLEGYLTAVFEAYERRLTDYQISHVERYAPSMFGEVLNMVPDKSKARRVWQGLRNKLGAKGLDYIGCAHLSELPEAERTMLAFIRKAFRETGNIETDYSDPVVLAMARTSKMVHRERHRMKAFIRFQLTKDGIYYAGIEPDYNVIPLIVDHFKNRYADQRWLIYDLKRKYGVYYDLHAVSDITLDFNETHGDGSDVSVSFDEREPFYQQLWKDYFKSANIPTRKNTKLHIRHVPRRYWKLLTEKRPD